MQIEAHIDIAAPKESVWQVITDIDNAASRITGIKSVEVMERPGSGLVGLKWRETRTMFGQTATEVMWITDAVEKKSYQTRAESHGAVYKSELILTETGGGTRLTMRFGAEPQRTWAKILAATLGRLFVGATRKALVADLEDIKAAAEQEP